MKIILTGTPPSTSHIYKYRSFGKFISGYMSAEGKKMKEDYRKEMRLQRIHTVLPPEDLISLEVEYYFPDNRRRDIDNFSKLWMDAGSGVLWSDDSQIKRLEIEKYIDKENPRVEINIEVL